MPEFPNVKEVYSVGVFTSYNKPGYYLAFIYTEHQGGVDVYLPPDRAAYLLQELSRFLYGTMKPEEIPNA